MKTIVSSELLLLAALYIPDVSNEELVSEGKCGTHGIYRDFFAGQDVEEVLGWSCPELLPVYYTFNKTCVDRTDYVEARKMLQSVMAAQEAPQEIEMPIRYSIYAVLVVLAEIKHLSGYDFGETQRALCRYLGDVPPCLLSTVLKRDSNTCLTDMEYELRSWLYRNKPPKGNTNKMLVWRADLADVVKSVIERYAAPIYFSV